ncbi:DUF4131 domain-containing protein [Janthinobacterium sp. 1_2014MBL_MicDiv]|uniref:DUF4131 domain-containing protein n=1 Tax=Janthinobacterium sp. 1_2014MBL_MicDiv TaxID=1644131 RepID=UPI0008F50446|nr:DUF4131 domain-containing protein [Janthinobacterium sp. 1_2014MBL_MicDiv]APA68121.1 hypothetical protein YQ44_10090 [Janthinobacterium sp. 1_2014MBL_MicDiv]
MRSFILGFFAGAFWLQTQAELPAHAGAALLLACLLFLGLGYAARGRHAVLRLSLGCLFGVIFGYFWAAFLAHAAFSFQLTLQDEGEDMTVVGSIASLPYHFEQGLGEQLC